MTEEKEEGWREILIGTEKVGKHFLVHEKGGMG